MSTLFALLDDVVALTKAAASKTAGVVGDDMAAGAQAMTGMSPDRELPVVWAVAKGSMRNKLLLIAGALLLSAVASWAISPLLIAGGLYLAYEGAEKLLALVRGHEAGSSEPLDEPSKIQGAIRTDLVLSAEIIVLALGIVADKPFLTQLGVLLATGIALTLGVYGTVAALIKFDDLGLWMMGSRDLAAQRIGRGIMVSAPVLMQLLTVGGAAAMVVVGGGILLHNVPSAFGASVMDWVHQVEAGLQALLGSLLLEFLVGLLAGGLLLLGHWATRTLRPRQQA